MYKVQTKPKKKVSEKRKRDIKKYPSLLEFRDYLRDEIKG